MAQLIPLAVVGCCVAGVSVAEGFSPHAYFCEDTPANLTTYPEAVRATAYFFDLTTGAADLDPATCSGLRVQTAAMIATMEDPLMISSSILAVARANLGRQMQINALEPRYAGDMDILLQLALTCTVAEPADENCVSATIQELPEPYLMSSPVFCDFAPASNATEGRPQAPDFAESLPMLCGAYRPEQAWNGMDDWLEQAAAWGIVPEMAKDQEEEQDGH